MNHSDEARQQKLGTMFRGYARDLRLTKQAREDKRVAKTAGARGNQTIEHEPRTAPTGGLRAPKTLQ